MKNKASSAPLIWGLTGGVASGKSTAARIFAELGLPVLDADQVARDLTRPGGLAADAVIKRFGTLDRGQIRAQVFADPQARADLEAILHPLIRWESERRIAKLARPDQPVIYEAALLVETGRDRELNGLIVVEAPQPLRRARLIARDKIPPPLADQMIDAQASDEERRARASLILDNSRDEAHLKAQIESWIAKAGWRH